NGCVDGIQLTVHRVTIALARRTAQARSENDMGRANRVALAQKPRPSRHSKGFVFRYLPDLVTSCSYPVTIHGEFTETRRSKGFGACSLDIRRLRSLTRSQTTRERGK